MNEPETWSDANIEALVRRSLDRGAERVDPRPAFDRLLADCRCPALAQGQGTSPAGRVEGGGSSWRGRRIARLLALGITAAAAVFLLAAFGLFESRPVLARAEALVREAKRAHLLPLDRCYLVEVRRDSDLLDEYAPLTSQVRQTRLWTRGDRFWVESVNPKQRWAWGRDQHNRFWIALGQHRGIRLEPDEMSRWLNLYCDLYSLRLETLLGDLLRDFDLRQEDSGSGESTASTTRVVRATPKAVRRHPNVRSIVMEIDAETRVVRRMVIERTRTGHPFATVTYTLAETRPLDDGKFELEGHLTSPYLVFTRDFEPRRRRELLSRCFGPKASAWFRLQGEGGSDVE